MILDEGPAQVKIIFDTGLILSSISEVAHIWTSSLYCWSTIDHL